VIKRVSHVGIVVNSLDEALPFYRDVLGLPLERIQTLEDQGLRAAVLRLGDVEIELLEPTTADSALARFRERRGDGIHHIAFGTDDIEAEMARLKQLSIQLIDQEPRRGLNGLICFLHPRAAGGVLLELEQSEG
jgi:methylmalonyl-CoA/ethylmalonyl-CoA epimerase